MESHANTIRSNQDRSLIAGIFDVDGVLLASPHERAWRDALVGLADQARFTSAMYEGLVAGKPRLDGAKSILAALNVPDADRKAKAYAECKQERLEKLIDAKAFSVFPDALRFVRALDGLGWPLAAASSSKNANDMLRKIPFDNERSLFDVFRVNVCGRDLPKGKPDPAIFLLAAKELHVPPASCFVVEDAPSGIQAACAGDMMALGVARLDDAALLQAAGADMVVKTLDLIAELVAGHIHRTVA